MTQLLETTFSESLNVDRENGVIRNVKILGRESKNGREYTAKAMQEACQHYSSTRVFIDHNRSGKERSFTECIGIIDNCRVSDDGVYGDLNYNRSHEQAEKVCEAAERFPKTFGLSHDAEGKTARRGGKTLVESVTKVRSVDIVSQPATNNGLFESDEGDDMPKTKSIYEVVNSLPAGTEYRQQLLEMEGAETTQMEAPAAEASPEEAIKKAFGAKIMAIIADDSIDMATTQKRVKELIKSLEATKEKAVEETPDEETPPEDPAMSESVQKLNAKIARMEARDACRDLMESEGVTNNSTLLEALIPLSEDKRKELVKQFKPQGGTRRLTESSGIQPGLKRDNNGVSDTYASKWKAGLEKAKA